jgi:SAM-dependent methyltransferase/ribosomal protein S27E
LKESEIRPKALFDEYLAAVQEDIALFFKEKSGFVSVPCPGCRGSVGAEGEKFVKDGFPYVKCPGCGTLFVSPRPPRDALDRFYRESRSSRFWVDRFYRETEEARREKIFVPRARDVVEKTHALLPNIQKPSFADIGAGYGTFLEEARRLSHFESLSAIEPFGPLADVCESKGFSVVRSTVEKAFAAGPFDVVSSFELFEHVFDPAEFLKAIWRLVKPGGLFFMTTLSGAGFDLVLLGPRSKSLSPPHHLNFINPFSLATLLRRVGFETIEITTPGQLDVEIVLNADKEAPVNCDPFTRKLLEGNADVRSNFQEFLRKNCLSSHVRAIARKPE